MASYMDVLGEDRERIGAALAELAAQQERRIEELRAALAEHSAVLDQKVLRTIVFRNIYGAGQTETLSAETETEEASKPVTAEVSQIEKETQLLSAYQEALKQLQAGAPMDALGRTAPATQS